MRETNRYQRTLALILPLLTAFLLLHALLATTAPQAAARGADPPTYLVQIPAIFVGPNLISLTQVTTEIQQPTAIVHAGDERLFVTTKAGVIHIMTGTVSGTRAVLPTPFLDLSAEIPAGVETGLFDIAFDPGFTQNGFFYVSYFNLAQQSIVARYAVSAANPNVADAGSRAVVLTVDQPGPQHNGGGLAFGPDGYLYVSLGDGQCCGDPQNDAQNLGVLLGKILRLDVSALPFVIPPDNPYVGVTGARPEIWASGLRNPWRINFDGVTGDLFVADVGEQAWEELNVEPAGSPGGANYGWKCYEGALPFDPTGCAAPGSYAFPIFSYSHAAACAITGGDVYRGTAYPSFAGSYFFADFCAGRFWSTSPGQDGAWITRYLGGFNLRPTAFGHDVRGELYVGGFTTGIFQVVPAP